jgi:hypothetical protein
MSLVNWNIVTRPINMEGGDYKFAHNESGTSYKINVEMDTRANMAHPSSLYKH